MICCGKGTERHHQSVVQGCVMVCQCNFVWIVCPICYSIETGWIQAKALRLFWNIRMIFTIKTRVNIYDSSLQLWKKQGLISEVLSTSKLLLYRRGHTLHLLKCSSAVSESKVTGMEAGDHLFSQIFCDQGGFQEENKGIEMRHFCPPELDFLWKAIRRVRGSGSCTYSRVVWQVSRWVTTSSNRESALRRKGTG